MRMSIVVRMKVVAGFVGREIPVGAPDREWRDLIDDAVESRPAALRTNRDGLRTGWRAASSVRSLERCQCRADETDAA